jgi:hypothetical protein
VIFFWDHETDSFKFSQDLRKLRNENPSQKTTYLKHLQEDELIKLEFMLKKSRHYLPILPSVKYYFYLPVFISLLYLLGCLIWYSVILSEASNEKEKSDKIDENFKTLLIIGLVMLLGLIGCICLHDFKCISRLNRRQKEFDSTLVIFNNGGFSGKEFEFDAKDAEFRIKTTDVTPQEQVDRHWTGICGLFGAFVVFELTQKYKQGEASQVTASGKLSDGNILNRMKKKVVEEE